MCCTALIKHAINVIATSSVAFSSITPKKTEKEIVRGGVTGSSAAVGGLVCRPTVCWWCFMGAGHGAFVVEHS